MAHTLWGKLLINVPGRPLAEYNLTEGSLSIGSDRTSDLVLSAPGVAPVHCKIVCDSRGCEIIDLRSATGVSINQRPVTFQKLSPGDIIALGSVTMTYQDPESDLRSPAGPGDEAGGFGDDGEEPLTIPHFKVRKGASPQTFTLTPGKVLVIGTDKECDVILPFGKKIFPRHAVVEWASDSRVIRKLYDPAIITINDTPVKQHQALQNGDIVTLGEVTLEFIDPLAKGPRGVTEMKLRDHPPATATKSRLAAAPQPTVPEHELKEETVSIGRDPSNVIVLNHETISRFHSKIEFRNKTYHLMDLHSTNGTFVNGMMTEDSVLNRGDLIQIGDFEFLFDGKMLRQASREGEARIDAVNLKRTITKDLVILNDISLSIYPRELVAIVGGSGAGKSTLMNALGGFSPADSGTVFVNGINFYKFFDAFQSSLGYVPQDDIIHKELTVFRALHYAACLRMPEDTKKEERESRIEQILKDLQLSHRRDTVITRLSGGERKRVSIGVELLTRPRLFFLDEPTSGLDPGLEADMMNIFRVLANQGHTTVLITHATKNLDICDQVVFLARGGHLAYFGPPREAIGYFEAEDFTDIYVRLEREKRADLWGRQFKNSAEYRTYVEDRLKEIEPQQKMAEETAVPAREKQKKKTKKKRSSAFRQFSILAARYLEIIVRDTRNFAILLLQAPLIGLLLSLVYGRDIFDKTTGNYNDVKSLLFFLICICIWFGTSNAAREIAKEIAIYRRERFINIGIVPYILSKVAVLSFLCVIQTSILMAIICLKVKMPDLGFTMYKDIFLTMALTSIDAMAMGLMISAIVNNPDKAASIVPILLIPQIVFSGAIIPLKGAAEIVSYFTLSRWGFELLGYITDAKKLPLMTTPVLKRSTEGIFDIIPSTHWTILLGYLVMFVLLACLFQRLKDYSRVR
ncbi:MAG: FHA domain-containing protein [Candidatus Eremiobacteraeota bacterium]|nr:FHA domain-containing protein [Candidatus Eremiobacteraeota bacterium]